jgi:hypothetical protein
MEIEDISGNIYILPKLGMILNYDTRTSAKTREYYLDYTTGNSTLIFISKETYEKVKAELLKEI